MVEKTQLEIELDELSEAEKAIKRLDKSYISEESRRIGLEELKERKEDLVRRIKELERGDYPLS